MAAYAALVSLMHTIEQIQQHPRPPISLDKQQVRSLNEKVTFLQEFLEGPYSMHHDGDNNEADPLEMQIADAAHAAEDIIESHIVDQILFASTSRGIRCFEFFKCFGPATNQTVIGSTSHGLYEGLQKVIEEDMDIIGKEVMEIKEKMGAVQHHPERDSSISATPASTVHNVKLMVGLDDVLTDVMDKLTRGQSDRQIIPIVGMGGIGKTTLARTIYHNQLIVQHFYLRSWVTISQEYKVKEILLQLLQEDGGNLSNMNAYEIGDKLYKCLCGRRYLIIIDDIWDIQVWDQLKIFFPDNNNGSTIMLTTRLAKLGFQINKDRSVEMKFLDEDTSWELLCRNVFRKEDCPVELEAIGKKIAKNCKGLPLSLVVIGGLLAKSEKTQEYWEYIVENLNSIVSLEDDEHCLTILHTSYKQLPTHLKPCFLHLGIFPEDYQIRVSELIRLWVSEGFVKPIGGKSLEEVADLYFKELIDRNLVLVEKCNSCGKIKYCKMHDLMRDLCLREAQKQKFVCVIRMQDLSISQGTNRERCISIHQSIRKNENCHQVLNALKKSSPDVRSLHLMGRFLKPPSPFCLKLLRVYSMDDGYFTEIERHHNVEAIFRQVNLRYIDSQAHCVFRTQPSSFTHLWNLQTLILRNGVNIGTAPSEIWMMHQLRHVVIPGLQLPDPPCDYTSDIVLENLQTLSVVNDFKCSEEVVRRIPNIKKLNISYEAFERGSADYLNNLGNLHKLESFGLVWWSITSEHISCHLLHNLTFPNSLKKLTLETTHLSWEDLSTKIGSLPLLQVLKLKRDSCIGHKWETSEGGFHGLKFLLINNCDLRYWKTDITHFPRLEHLVLIHLRYLEEVHSSIGDIPTLQSIKLESCARSASKSAIRIQEEQEDLGNVDLKVSVFP